MKPEAVIFDMDGVLVDSEPLWRRAEIETFRGVGVPLTEAMCHETTGLRLHEVVAHWAARYPWSEPRPEAVARGLLARVRELILAEAEPLSGIDDALKAVDEAGSRVALASSSPLPLIEAVLDRFAMTGHFEVVRSADGLERGKPHPAIYLVTAAAMGVLPDKCVAIEDSVNGVLAAKAAGMACVAVPEPGRRPDVHLAGADAVVDSLTAIDAALLASLSLDGGRGRRPDGL